MRRQFTKFFGPSAFFIVVAGALVSWRSSQHEADRALQVERAAVQRGSTGLNGALAPLFRHARSLRREAPVRYTINHADSPDSTATGPMTAAFLSLLQRNPAYAQVRWIDMQGRERVRLDVRDGHVERIPAVELQNQAHLYYVRESLPLPDGALYVSRLDLNEENDPLAMPLRHMFRVAIRVDDDRGQPQGLIVLALDGSNLFSALDKTSTIRDRLLTLADSEGRWLGPAARQPPPEGATQPIAPAPGAALPSLPQQWPSLWAQIQQSPDGAIQHDGLWAWNRLAPADAGPALRTAGQVDAPDPPLPWTVVSYRPMTELQAMQTRALLAVAWPVLLALLMAALLCWRLAREGVALVEARRRAEEAAQAKASFLANMSHEIRTPLNAVVGLTHLMRRDECTPRQALRLSKIDAAARHLLSLLNDILDMSKLDAGQARMESLDFSLEGLLDGVLSFVTPIAEAKGLRTLIDLGPAGTCPTWLRGDPLRLRQALLNYASNAVKFTHAGSVTLRVRPTDTSQPGDAADGPVSLLFEVIDTGIGMTPEALSRLFVDFEQADQGISRQYGGTGLGLAITRRIARLMDGDAGATSRPGEGSTFWLRVQLQRGSPVAETSRERDLASAERQIRERHAGTRVLLAEDNPVNREIAIELLSQAGLDVTAVEDGEQALREALAGDYAVLLLDMQMPLMDGLEVSRRLRASGLRPDLRILALTANAFETDRDACRHAGMDDFIVKPVDPAVLFATLLRWLSRNDG